jgi:Cu(I)/Ag(I) efflux system membrane protein CusA/SilA
LAARLADGRLKRPPGVSYEFAGTYQNQLRSERSLGVLVPVALALVFVLLHLQFRSLASTLILLSSLVVAAAGGMIGLWLYAQPWFLDFAFLGRSVREVFQVGPVHLSVAVWIGFIALIGIATDDGVVVTTYLRQVFGRSPPTTVAEVRALVREAGARRVRPCLMTTATTLLALLPVIASTGRGSDLMMPLALPLLGGMVFELLTLFVVPVLTCAWEEARLSRHGPA